MYHKKNSYPFNKKNIAQYAFSWHNINKKVNHFLTNSTCCSSTRIQSLPGKRILWRTISPIMHPTDHISTRTAEIGKWRRRKKSKVNYDILFLKEGEKSRVIRTVQFVLLLFFFVCFSFPTSHLKPKWLSKSCVSQPDGSEQQRCKMFKINIAGKS